MRLRVVHETRYVYEEPVTTSHHLIHVTPRAVDRQTCVLHDIAISPSPGVLRKRIDYFGNATSYFGIHEAHRTLTVVAKSDVRLKSGPRPLSPASPPWEEVQSQTASDRKPPWAEAREYRYDSPYVRTTKEVREFAEVSFPRRRPLLEAMLDLTARISTEFKYDPTATGVSTPVAEVMQLRRGVCQDFAHVEVACLRSLGLSARYVSGYLLTTPPPGKPRLVGADGSHAWIATFFPNVGWVDFDPVNNSIPSDHHITVAYGRDFGDVTPLRGVVQGGGGHSLEVSVDVSPVDDVDPAE
jgi:transglutaminase-like putative cysteine protease